MKKTAKKKIIIIPLLLLLFAVMISGCSSAEDADSVSDAYSFIDTQEYDEACALFDTAIEAGDRLRLSYRGKGIALLGKGSYDEAIECFEKALSYSDGILNDMDYDINYYLATAFYKKGDTDEAINIYNAILSLKPNEADALYLRGAIYAGDGLIDLARLDFEKVIALTPDNYNRLISIYSILSENGYKENGQIYLKNAMETGSKKMTNYEKGQISFYLEDYESARTYLEKAESEAGAEAVLFLGKTYEILGDNNYAISVYSSYINSGESSPEILNEMGLCKMSMGDYQGALRDFQSAMEIEDNNMLQTLKYNEIVSYEYLSDFASARTLLEAYIKSYPDDENAKREYTFLKTR